MANDDLERERGEYESRRLARDVADLNLWGIAGAALGSLGGPAGMLIGGSVGAALSGAKSISERRRRDDEWDGADD